MDPTANPAIPGSWCSRGLIVTVSGPGGSKFSVRVPRPFVRIGSDRRAEVSLPEGDLLPCHLFLHATETGIYCLGLSDATPSGWLTPKIRVEIGPYRIKAAFDDALTPPAPGANELCKKGSLPGPWPYLEITDSSGKSNPVELAVDRPLSLIGRRSPSSLRLGHKTVSRVHCALYWSGEALWAIDLLSGNGTRLDQNLIDAAVWRPGYELAVGSFRMQYLRLQIPAQAAPSPQWATSPRRFTTADNATDVTSLVSRLEDSDPEKSGPEVSGTHPEDASTDSSMDLSPVTVRLHADNGDSQAAADLSGQGSDLLAPCAELNCTDRADEGTVRSNLPAVAPLSCAQERSPAAIHQRALQLALAEDARRSSGDLVAGHSMARQRGAVAQTMRAMVEQVIAQSDLSSGGILEPASLAAEALRRLMSSADLCGPVQLFEQELSMVCLTLVKARQSAEQDSSLPAPEMDRLIAAIRGLEQQLARQATTSGQVPAPVLGGPEPALLTSPPATTTKKGSRGGALEASASRFFCEPSGMARAVRAADRDCSPTEKPDSFATRMRLVLDREDAPTTAASVPPGVSLDDRMLERLLRFKAKRDSTTQRRRLLWSAAAAIAIVLIVALAGAAKLWSDRTSQGEDSGGPPSGGYTSGLG